MREEVSEEVRMPKEEGMEEVGKKVREDEG